MIYFEVDLCLIPSSVLSEIALLRKSKVYHHRKFSDTSRVYLPDVCPYLKPIPENRRPYDRLFGLYRRLHDAFGVSDTSDDLADIMKELLAIRDQATT